MEPIEAIIFDFHSTLVDNGNPRDWLIRALKKRAVRRKTPLPSDEEEILQKFEKELFAEPQHVTKQGKLMTHLSINDFIADLHRVWEHAKKIDPKSSRDLSPALHRSVFSEVMKTHFEINEELSECLYDTMADGWIAYEDTLPTLRAIQEKKLRMGIISNVGFDIRPVLERENMSEFFESVVLSCEMDEVKPSRAIFVKALDELGVDSSRCLMVGDDVHADGGAALLGIRTLILPKTIGPMHGLGLVAKLLD